VRGKDQTAVGAFFEQLLIRPLLKALIADRDDLVNQITVEIDR